jgi:hypothetical protein
MIKNMGSKLVLVVQVYYLSTWEAEAGASWIQSQPGLHGKFQASLGM